MKRLKEAFDLSQVILDLEVDDLASAIRESVRYMVADGILPEQTEDQVVSALLQREQDAPTAIGHAVAVPHAYLDSIEEQIVLFVRLAHPVNLGAPDGIPTQFLFFLLGPPGSAAQHLDTLAYVARLMSDDEFRYEVGKARASEDLLSALGHFTQRTSPEPSVPEKLSDGLAYTGQFCGGLRKDLLRRRPHYWSDILDGLHAKCAGSTLFLFFACLAPAVTFGGVMAVLTDGQIGAVEMIAASAFCGVIFALISGQPLVILGGTGPLLVFTAILFRLCSDQGIPFLPSYAWVGLWSAGFLVILAVTDASCLMRYFTRFTDEIFSALISIIFIYEAIKSLVHIFQDLDVKKHHDTALLSLLLALGTFYIAMSLSRFRRSSYLRPKIREFFADFGPAIALGAMTVVSVWLHEVFLDALPAPDAFGTTSGRPWTVDLFAAPLWVRFAAIGPALLVTVLVYLDQNITARIVNSPDHRLHKGEAYHLDLGVVGLLMAACSMFGLPWLVAATVRSLNHVRSLATVEEVVSPTGETRERVIHVRENRLTGLAIHLLIGLSLFLLPLLKTIPMAVLYGLFLFMGVVSMSGNQFFERMSLWLKDPALYPVTHYIRRVPRWTIHAFTLLQLVCLGVLWFVKSSAIGILFPVFIALLVPVRLLAGKYFSAEQLAALDAEEEPEDEGTHWAG
ncbi:MAG: PTS transporter subunit EIIA [Planctomycetaceae bacterium]|jgi:mannitol/fructose-specific phosphotransferase system IIA component (Ntr-type)|nr:PTS transporter subunit EIIA [Planctomycetaceae bacterium]MBT6154334.1 PTS transporter subunit EIIA [Planctomycetaceae bacterium]MBT6496741.1 PTS transporter subunit EIIA [Planctomycetaceae bacterium]